MFLLTLVIVDDIVALLVIALAYTDEVSVAALVVALALFGVAVLDAVGAGIRNGVAYFVVAVGMWVAMLESGVHPTIAGVALGLLATAYPPTRADLERAGVLWRRFREQPTPEYARSTGPGLRQAVSPNERLQHLIDPWTSLLVVPLVRARQRRASRSTREVLERAASSPITIGIIVGLVVGKLVGITAATWLGSRRWLGRFPLDRRLAAAVRAGDGRRDRLHRGAAHRRPVVRGRAARGGQARDPRRLDRCRRCSASSCSG